MLKWCGEDFSERETVSGDMSDTEMFLILIGSGIFIILILAGVLTMLLGFICWIFGKKTTGDKLCRFGAFCGSIMFSLGLLGVAWSKRSWLLLIMLVAISVTSIGFTIKWKLKDEQKQ